MDTLSRMAVQEYLQYVKELLHIAINDVSCFYTLQNTTYFE